MTAYAKIARDGRVESAVGVRVQARRIRRGRYEISGIPGGWSSTIFVQPSQLPAQDCATLCAALQPGRSKSDEVSVYTYAAVTLDTLSVGEGGRLRWDFETEAADADFSLAVIAW